MPPCTIRVYRADEGELKSEKAVVQLDTYGAALDWAVSTYNKPAASWRLLNCSRPDGQGALNERVPEDGCTLELVEESAGQLRAEERISVAPKPLAGEKDVQPLFQQGLKGGLEELIDNSLCALLHPANEKLLRPFAAGWAPHIWIEFYDNADDTKAAFVIQDNGIGMPEDVARTFLRISQSWSRGIPPLPRNKSQPLPLDMFRHPSLSRFGVGANAIQGFGGTCDVTTRQFGSSVQFQVVLDREQRLKHFDEGGSGWEATFRMSIVSDTGSSQASGSDHGDLQAPFLLRHGTRICITRLHEEVLASLRNKDVLMQIRAEIAQDYFFFLCGFPEIVRSHIPAHLQYEHIDNGLCISVFSKALSRPALSASALQEMPEADSPVMLQVITRMEELRSKQVPLNPFMLHLRYVPNECRKALEEDKEEDIQEVPGKKDEVLASLKEVAHQADNLGKSQPGGSRATPASKAQGKRGGGSKGKKGATPQTGTSGRAAAPERQKAPPPKDADAKLDQYDEKFKPAVVDMLLMLFNFPARAGATTKPNAGKGNGGDAISSWKDKEPFIYTFWSGRMLPHCSLSSALPKLVEKAQLLGRSLALEKAYKLDSDHLTGILLLSPECTTLYHKTDVQKGHAYDAFINLGPEPDVVLGNAEPKQAVGRFGTMFAYDFKRLEFRADPMGAYATRLLLSHFEQHWSTLDEDGYLVDGLFEPSPYHNDRLVEQSTKYVLASHPVVKDALCAKELVKRVATGDVGADAGEGTSSTLYAMAKDFYIVKKFYSLGSDTRHQHFVEVCRWRPSWFPKPMDECQLENVSSFQPLPHPDLAARTQAAEVLVRNWEEANAPHHLAFYKREEAAPKAFKRRSSAKGPADQEAAGKMEKRETTVNPLEAQGLEQGGNELAFTSSNLFEQVEVVVAAKGGRPLPRMTVTKHFVTKQMQNANQWARTLVAKLQRGNEEVWQSKFISVNQSLEYCVSGFRQKALAEGSYTLSLEIKEATDEEYPLPALKMQLNFKVKPDPATKIIAEFVDADGNALGVGERRVRLGQPMEPLLLELENDKGTKMPLPPLAQLKAELKVSLMLADGHGEDADADGDGSWKVRQNLHLPRGVELQEDSLGLLVPNLEVSGFSLGGSSRSARLRVQFRDLTCNLDVTLLAGAPSKVIVTSVDSTKRGIAKGEGLGTLIFSVEDAFGNRYLPRRGHEVKLKLTLQNLGNAKQDLVEELTLKLKEEGGKGVARGTASISSLVAMGPVGSHARISVKATAADFEVEQEAAFDRVIFPVHLGFTHPMLESALAAQSRRKVRRNDGEASSSHAGAPSASAEYPGLVNVLRLDLLDYVEKFRQPGKQLPIKLDVNSWRQLLDLHAGLEELPDGSVLRPTGDRYTVRQRKQLISQLNSLLDEQKAVHEVVAVVEPGATQLRGMAVQICRADNDELDPDWQADVKMRLCYVDSDGDATQLVLPDLHYCLRSNTGSVSFNVDLSDEYFVRSNTVRIIFADAHNEYNTYGQMYIRQSRNLRDAHVLPIGDTFSGAKAKYKDKSGVLQPPPAAPGASAPDPCCTLEGWKLGNVGVMFDNLRELPQLQDPGPLVSRNQSIRLHFACADQFGAPMEVPMEQRQWVQQHATLSVISAAPSSSDAGSSSAGSGSAIIKSWAWSMLPVPTQHHTPPWSMPVCSVEVEVQRGTGASLLQLQLPAPGPGCGVELGTLRWPVMLEAKAMKRDGYVVQALAGGEVVRERAAPAVESEGVGRKRQKVAAGQHAAEEGRVAKKASKASKDEQEQEGIELDVSCREEQDVQLQVELVDEEGAAIGQVEDGDFKLETPEHAQLSARLGVSGGRLVLSLKAPRAATTALQRRARAGSGSSQPLEVHDVWVRPASTRVSHAVPLRFSLQVHPGSYPLAIDEPDEGESFPSSFSLPDELEDPCMFHWLPARQVIGADGHPWKARSFEQQREGMDNHTGASPRAAEMLRMQVEWRQQVQPASGSSPAVFAPSPPPLWERFPMTVDAQGWTKCRVKMPILPGTWALYTSNLPGVSSDWVQTVTVKPGRPYSIKLADDASAPARQLQPHPHKTLVHMQQEAQSGGRGQRPRAEEMPGLSGWLCDRHDHRCCDQDELRVALCLRQRNVPDLVLSHSIVGEGSRFEFKPAGPLVQLLQRAAAHRQASNIVNQPLVPEVQVVVKCTEQLVDGEWQELAGDCAVQEYIRATLLEVTSNETELAKLVEKMNKNTRTKEMLEQALADLRRKLAAQKQALDEAQRNLQRAQSTVDARIQVIPGATSVADAITAMERDSAAARAELLGIAGQAHLQEIEPGVYRPWLAPGRHSPVVAQAKALRDLRPGKVLGPLVCLGAVERKEVAEAMAMLVNDSLSCVLVLGGDARRQVDDHLRLSRVPRFDILDLEDRNAASEFRRERVFEDDPQQRLNISSNERFKPVFADRQVKFRFVGYAVNLVVLPQALLNFRLGNQRHTLRQSVLWYFLRDAMVFEAREDLDAFVAACEKHQVTYGNRLISLDGKRYNFRRGMHSTETERQRPGLHWAVTPAEHLVGEHLALDNKLAELQVRMSSATGDAANLRVMQQEVERCHSEAQAATASYTHAQNEAASKEPGLRNRLAVVEEELKADKKRMAEHQRQQDALRRATGASQGAGATAARPTGKRLSGLTDWPAPGASAQRGGGQPAGPSSKTAAGAGAAGGASVSGAKRGADPAGAGPSSATRRRKS